MNSVGSAFKFFLLLNFSTISFQLFLFTLLFFPNTFCLFYFFLLFYFIHFNNFFTFHSSVLFLRYSTCSLQSLDFMSFMVVKSLKLTVLSQDFWQLHQVSCGSRRVIPLQITRREHHKREVI